MFPTVQLFGNRPRWRMGGILELVAWGCFRSIFRDHPWFKRVWKAAFVQRTCEYSADVSEGDLRWSNFTTACDQGCCRSGWRFDFGFSARAHSLCGPSTLFVPTGANSYQKSRAQITPKCSLATRHVSEIWWNVTGPPNDSGAIRVACLWVREWFAWLDGCTWDLKILEAEATAHTMCDKHVAQIIT